MQKKKKFRSAHEQYGFFVGEVGIDEHRLLHELELWQLQQISSGYGRRHRSDWLRSRFLTWVIARCNGSKAESPEEMFEFLWEREEREEQENSDENIAELMQLVEECRRENNK